ncbi:hypothetical protein GH714_018943 [Hevea brasiliensis]|uniref:Uncharacterized protein n=1 Tax=Hevea brasiliensis TaxID=3981 RepID=A0A6A6MXT2_HEVBR|nr:hypothetical protein GH714_018943 [Hevea brasiliensis]
MGCLRKLQKLSVDGNPLVSPPMEVVEQGLHAVKEYLSEKMNASHQTSKKKSWVGKLVKYGTFNGSARNNHNRRKSSCLNIAPLMALLLLGTQGCSHLVASSRLKISSLDNFSSSNAL